MAYRIECDRCGKTETVTSTSEMPSRWLQFHDLVRGNGSTQAGLDAPVRGGTFCPSCVRDLERWREPIPQVCGIDPA